MEMEGLYAGGHSSTETCGYKKLGMVKRAKAPQEEKGKQKRERVIQDTMREKERD